MKCQRLVPLACLTILLHAAGCRQGGDVSRPGAAPKPAPSAVPAAAPADAPAETPSLASALREQEQHEARSLSTTLGIRLEDRPGGATPEWFAAAATTPGRSAGVASARTLVEAVNQAITKAGRQIEARGGRPQSMKIERAAYARLATGTYSAWAAMGDGSNMGDVIPAPAAAPRVEAASPQAPMPSLRDPKAAIPTGERVAPAVPPATPAPSAAPTQESTAAPAATTTSVPGAGLDKLVATEPPFKAPSWWSPTPVQQGDRVVLGVMVEARTTGECIAAARRTARTKLAAAIGAEPESIVAQRTLVTGVKADTLRMFAVMSCKGTLVPPAEPPQASPAESGGPSVNPK